MRPSFFNLKRISIKSVSLWRKEIGRKILGITKNILRFKGTIRPLFSMFFLFWMLALFLQVDIYIVS